MNKGIMFFIVSLLALVFACEANAAVSQDDDLKTTMLKEFVASSCEELGMDEDSIWTNHPYVEGDKIVISFFLDDTSIDEFSKEELKIMKSGLTNQILEAFSESGTKAVMKTMFETGIVVDMRFYDKYGRLIANVPLNKKSLK